MTTPSRTKACTFSACDGRMILTQAPSYGDQAILANATARQPDVVPSLWECDTDPSHIEPALANDL